MRVTSEEYGADNVTVQLMFNEEPNVAYNITVLNLTTMTLKGITGFQAPVTTLILSYNIVYRVSFMASRCGQSLTNTSTFHYGELTRDYYY